MRAAQLGQPDAQNNVGCQFLRGLGVENNYELARQWFKRAAEEGLAEAQFNYAEMLEFGKGGEIDEKGALDYYQNASLQGIRINTELPFSISEIPFTQINKGLSITIFIVE